LILRKVPNLITKNGHIPQDQLQQERSAVRIRESILQQAELL
jgi:hypothetical protein